jgi:O-acetyl-ADP-ribose deacetylase (regulator of RNase III)
MTIIQAVQANITSFEADAIVNAANSSLLGGGGVDGAIHRAAGKDLVAECRLLGGAKTGEAKITKAYSIKSAKYIIHTVGPVYKGLGVEKSEPLLKSCYRNSLDLTLKYDIKSVAFSAISTGIYGYPLKDATRTAVTAIHDWLEAHPESNLKTITLVAFKTEDLDVMHGILDSLST